MPENHRLMERIDRHYTDHPFHGSRRMTAWLNQHQEEVNRERAHRLMRMIGLEAAYPKPRLSAADRNHRI